MSQENSQAFGNGEESQVYPNSQKRAYHSDTEEESTAAPLSTPSFKKPKIGKFL